jgi:hypothetical protein
VSLTGRPVEAVADLPPGIATLAVALQEMATLLPGLKAALERQARPGVPRLALRRSEIAQALGVKIRVLQREQAAGRFPRPDLHVGRVPLWTPETIRRWVEEGGRS